MHSISPNGEQSKQVYTCWEGEDFFFCIFHVSNQSTIANCPRYFVLKSMSHLAPKQLASCLPKVVPKLTEAFSDTHPKVKSSAEQALEEICKVIKNPEISSISPILLRALTDASGTLRALEALISTEFVHAIDAPSLSIIIPVVHRGLRDRAATTKRYAALISGNICTSKFPVCLSSHIFDFSLAYSVFLSMQW